ncbi:MAG: mono/diheme cytochrome c family protein [Cryomorphaceae bacterium]|jgi:mono/diheme cytochrome c family protein
MKISTQSISSKFSVLSLTAYFFKLTAVAAITTAIVGSTFSTANAQDAHPGEAIFKLKCTMCHGQNGEGIAIFPPLAGSEWVNGPEENLVKIQLRGLMGPITVKGKQYNGMMPNNAAMSDKDIADVLTYVRSSMGNKAPAITVDTVKAIRAQEAGNATPLTVKDLKSPFAAEVKPEVTPTPEVKPEVIPQLEAKPEPAPEAPAIAEGGVHPGKALYQAKCIACHGPTGNGVPPVFPPLAGSEWVNGPVENLIKIQLHGLSGPIEVKGKLYNGIMPNNAAMSNQEIADVLTYVRSNMGNNAPAVTADMVEEHRAQAIANPAAITVKDLVDPTAPKPTITGETELEGFKPAQHNSSGNTIFWALVIIGVCTLPAIVGFAKN